MGGIVCQAVAQKTSSLNMMRKVKELCRGIAKQNLWGRILQAISLAQTIRGGIFPSRFMPVL